MKLSKRAFLRTAFLSALAIGGVGFYSVGIEPYQLQTTAYNITTEKWPQDMAAVTAVLIADPHVGCWSVDIDRMNDIVDQVNDMKPDVVLLLGDYLHTPINYGAYIEPAPIAESLGRLKAPLGVHAVLGNHDWYHDGQGMWNALEKNGINVLENDALHVPLNDGSDYGLWIAGAADESTRHPDLKAAFSKVTGDDPVLLMMHDPGTFVERPDSAALSVAGHMHGGQVKLPVIGAPFNPSRTAPDEYFYGHINENGNDLIVSGGIGTSSLPVRMGATPEIVQVTIGPKP